MRPVKEIKVSPAVGYKKKQNRAHEKYAVVLVFNYLLFLTYLLQIC